MSAAWFCPSCQRHHAPHVETCPGGTGGVKTIMPGTVMPGGVPYTADDYRRAINSDPCIGCTGPCGNVACPKRLTITCGGTVASSTYRPDPRVSVSLTNSPGLPQ